MAIPDVTLQQFESEYRDRHLIHSALDYHAARTPDEPAVINATRGTRLTWAGLRDSSMLLAAELARMGFRKGDYFATSLPLHRSGKLKILAIASPERFAAVPEVPTIAESGHPGFRSITWFGLVAPPGTPAALAEKINRDVVASFRKPEVGMRFLHLMLEPIGGTPADGARFIAEEAALWSLYLVRETSPAFTAVDRPRTP